VIHPSATGTNRENQGMRDRLVQVIVLVEDLDTVQKVLEGRGFTVAQGGRHPGRGTANLIVAFGQQYLELLAIVDEGEAMASPQGRPVLDALSTRGPGLARWSVEPDDLQATAERVGLPIEHRERVLPRGPTVRWRAVGVDLTWREPWRCAFMTWDDPRLHPARTDVVHPNGARGFARLDVAAPDRSAALDWLGGTVPDRVQLTATANVPGPATLLVDTPTGAVPFDTTGL
jgi:hypothetical protein